MKILLPCLLYRKLSNSKAEQSMQMKRGVSLKSSPANTFSISWISPQTWQAPGEQGRSAFLYTAECLRGAKSWLRKSATGPRSTEFRLWWHKLATCQPAWFLNSVCLILTRVNCPLNEPLWTKKQCILEFHLLFFTWKKDDGMGGVGAHELIIAETTLAVKILVMEKCLQHCYAPPRGTQHKSSNAEKPIS